LFAIYQARVRLLFGNPKIISEVEEFLIGFAARRNRDLLNIHGTGASWTIAGVANNGRGPPGASAKAFKKMMGMQTRSAARSQRPAAAEEEIEPASVESETPNASDVLEIDEEMKEAAPSVTTAPQH
jgi:hypothetical protein